MIKKALALCLLGCAPLTSQQIPAPTELPGDIFYIKQTLPVGGNRDNLSYTTLDPLRLQLFLAYQHEVVVEDVKSDTVAGKISGANGAFGIALDNTGEFGYVSDGKLNQLDVFDRRTFEVVGIIPTAPNPGTVTFESVSGLIFVTCILPASGRNEAIELADRPMLRTDVRVPPVPTRASQAHPLKREGQPKTLAKGNKSEFTTIIRVIDSNSWRAIADLQLPNHVAFAQAAGDGNLYFGIPEKSEIARMDAEALRERFRRESSDALDAGPTPKEMQLRAGRPFDLVAHGWGNSVPMPKVAMLNLTDSRSVLEEGTIQILFFPLEQGCGEPRALAVDGRHIRLFVACGNMKMNVMNADTGATVATLPTDPGTEALAYDRDRGLIYAASSGSDGSLTIIRQDVTDSYAVIQRLPMPLWARTLSVDPITGLVYLVNDYRKSEPEKHPSAPDQGSFQLNVIGH